MKFLTEEQAINWCQENHINLDECKRPILSNNQEKFNIPVDAGQRVALVKSQWESFKDEDELLIWINDWSVWGSGERLHIFYRFRQSYGENRLLKEIPAQLITKDEYEDGLSVVTLAVLFLWDCYVIPKRGERLLFYSHDEFGAMR